jgi:RNA polymerase sigma-70 factor, ECF subfamily
MSLSTGDWEGTNDVTQATASESGGPRVDELYSLAYDELKRLAGAVRHGDPFATVTTTALVNEAWLKLSAGSSHRFTDERHFKHIVVRAMRQVLVDSARRRRSLKREGIHVPFDESIPLPASAEERVLAIDTALTRLAVLSPRQAQMVEARFFGGLDVMETARLLNVSEATIQRDWRLARAWLAIELTDAR